MFNLGSINANYGFIFPVSSSEMCRCSEGFNSTIEDGIAQKKSMPTPQLNDLLEFSVSNSSLKIKRVTYLTL